MKLTAIGMVKANQNVAARFRQATDAGKGLPGIVRVMQNAIADDKIKKAVPQPGPEEIHLRECGTVDAMRGRKLVSQCERISAHVGAEHTTVRDCQEVR